jgi:hypothetical protein
LSAAAVAEWPWKKAACASHKRSSLDVQTAAYQIHPPRVDLSLFLTGENLRYSKNTINGRGNKMSLELPEGAAKLFR